MNRRLILSVAWAYIGLMWVSMGHALFRLPDVGPIVAPTIFAAVALWPLARPGMSGRKHRIVGSKPARSHTDPALT